MKKPFLTKLLKIQLAIPSSKLRYYKRLRLFKFLVSLILCSDEWQLFLNLRSRGLLPEQYHKSLNFWKMIIILIENACWVVWAKKKTHIGKKFSLARTFIESSKRHLLRTAPKGNLQFLHNTNTQNFVDSRAEFIKIPNLLYVLNSRNEKGSLRAFPCYKV